MQAHDVLIEGTPAGLLEPRAGRQAEGRLAHPQVG